MFKITILFSLFLILMTKSYGYGERIECPEAIKSQFRVQEYAICRRGINATGEPIITAFDYDGTNKVFIFTPSNGDLKIDELRKWKEGNNRPVWGGVNQVSEVILLPNQHYAFLYTYKFITQPDYKNHHLYNSILVVNSLNQEFVMNIVLLNNPAVDDTISFFDGSEVSADNKTSEIIFSFDKGKILFNTNKISEDHLRKLWAISKTYEKNGKESADIYLNAEEKYPLDIAACQNKKFLKKRKCLKLAKKMHLIELEKANYLAKKENGNGFKLVKAEDSMENYHSFPKEDRSALTLLSDGRIIVSWHFLMPGGTSQFPIYVPRREHPFVKFLN